MLPWYLAVLGLAALVGILTVLLVAQSENRAAPAASTVTVTPPQPAGTTTVPPTVTKTVTETATQTSTARPADGLPTYTTFPAEPFPAGAGATWVRKGPYSGGAICNSARTQWQGTTSECFGYRGSAYFYGLQQSPR